MPSWLIGIKMQSDWLWEVSVSTNLSFVPTVKLKSSPSEAVNTGKQVCNQIYTYTAFKQQCQYNYTWLNRRGNQLWTDNTNWHWAFIYPKCISKQFHNSSFTHWNLWYCPVDLHNCTRSNAWLIRWCIWIILSGWVTYNLQSSSLRITSAKLLFTPSAALNTPPVWPMNRMALILRRKYSVPSKLASSLVIITCSVDLSFLAVKVTVKILVEVLFKLTK